MRDARPVEANSRMLACLKTDLKVKLQPILNVNYFFFFYCFLFVASNLTFQKLNNFGLRSSPTFDSTRLLNSDPGVEFEAQRFGEVSRVGIQRTPTNVVDSINHGMFPVPQPKVKVKSPVLLVLI